MNCNIFSSRLFSHCYACRAHTQSGNCMFAGYDKWLIYFAKFRNSFILSWNTFVVVSIYLDSVFSVVVVNATFVCEYVYGEWITMRFQDIYYIYIALFGKLLRFFFHHEVNVDILIFFFRTNRKTSITMYVCFYSLIIKRPSIN